MFPTLFHFIKDVFGIDLRFLEIVNTFGLFVAVAIGAAFWAMQTEFARKTKLGHFPTKTKTVITGTKAPWTDYAVSGLTTFLFGYKIVYLLVESGNGFVPQEHILTTEGNWLFGIIGLAVGLGNRYYTDKKERLAEPISRTVSYSIADDMSNITAVALISGFLGAKVFHLLETPSEIHLSTFIQDIFTSGGWTFYGGLICGAIGVLWYTTKQGYHWRQVLDGGGPAMMLSYGIGRFGCHFSGDGDWGIANTQPSSWLPNWAWAYKYPHNVLGKDFPGPGMEQIPGCTGNYCYQLSTPVFPTPLYEAILGLGLFFILWFLLRNRNWVAGQFFCVYMIFAGLERFVIELIREHGDSLYNMFGMIFSQAQMISVTLIVLGLCGYLFFQKHPLKISHLES